MEIIFVSFHLILGFFLSRYFYKKITKENKTLFLAEVLGVTIFGIFSLGILSLKSNYQSLEIIAHYILYLPFIISLLYLGIYDFLRFSLPKQIVKQFLFFSVISNILIASLRLIFFELKGVYVFEILPIGFASNLFIAILFITGIFLIIKLTKQKKMDSSDIEVFGGVGFLIGISNSVIFIVVTLFSASLIALVYALKIKKFQNLLIPLLPFILIGFTVSISFGKKILDYLNL